MSAQGMAFVALVIGALSLFGGVLGYASWEESSARRRAEKAIKQREEKSPLHRTGTRGQAVSA